MAWSRSTPRRRTRRAPRRTLSVCSRRILRSLPWTVPWTSGLRRIRLAALEVLLSGVGIVAAAVGLASAFNTSAASVLLRSHDFAVLRSVGMGERALRRMLAYECVRTAAWGLALGLATALAFDLWVYARGGISVRSLGFVVPWAHVAGAVALVALVLLASCAYALRQLRSVPLLDAVCAD